MAAFDTVMLPLADTNLSGVDLRLWHGVVQSGRPLFSPGTFVVSALASGTAFGVRPSMSHGGGCTCACEDTGNDRLVLGYTWFPPTANLAVHPCWKLALLPARPIEVTAESVIVLGLVLNWRLSMGSITSRPATWPCCAMGPGKTYAAAVRARSGTGCALVLHCSATRGWPER